ncbi:hypothetical protein PINS_up016081 [Pythium insidiosum]|nr:hypothetical protein PINS_up016081 [Pythium insidiosum]
MRVFVWAVAVSHRRRPAANPSRLRHRVDDAAAKREGVYPEHQIEYFTNRLSAQTAALAEGCEGVVMFVNDTADAETLRKLHAGGTRALFLRCAGFNMVDLEVAKELGIPVLRVPAYSPYALNFRLGGLLGFDVHGKTIGVVGTGKIGALFARIAAGFGCRQNPEALSYGVEYVSLDEIWAQADIISLHCPLFPSTKHIVNEESISKMKPGVLLINTSRGGLIDTAALVKGLKSKKIGGVGLDVVEGEGDYFYSDHSGSLIPDDTLARLFTFSNVIITGHQAFFTKEALENIATTTMDNIKAYVSKSELKNRVG